MGFTLLEMLIVLSIIGIMFGTIVAMKNPFQEHMALRNSALALQRDLRNAQAYAMSRRDGYQFYGVRLFNNLGINMLQAGDLRDGWKIIRYEPQAIPSGFNVDALPQAATVMKSSAEPGDNNLQSVDKTFFERGVIFSVILPISDLQPTLAAPQNSIVFNSEGSATTNGGSLLNADPTSPPTQNIIILAGFGHTITLVITPLTGHIEVQPMQ